VFFDRNVTGAQAMFDQLEADISAAGWSITWNANQNQFAATSPTGRVAAFELTFAPGDTHVATLDYVAAVGIDQSATTVSGHTNASPPQVMCLDKDLGMRYWLSVTDDRIVMMMKLSATYQPLYVGGFIPASSASQYPHPLFVGGGKRGVDDWRNYERSFIFTYASNTDYACSAMLLPDGQWQWVVDYRTSPQRYMLDCFTETESLCGGRYNTTYYKGKTELSDYLKKCLGGGFTLYRPKLQMAWYPYDAAHGGGVLYGELNGWWRITGKNNVPENTLDYDGMNLIVCQNGTHTTENDFMAMEMI
jgi:hypothetical protein